MSDKLNKLLNDATQARRENRQADAKRILVEAVELCRTSENRSDLAKALTELGQIERDLQNNEAALEHYEEALAIYRAEGDALKIAHTVRHVGDIHQHEGHRELAEPCYREALKIYRSHERTSPLDLANAIRGLAILTFDAGESDEAKLLWQEARDLYAGVDVAAGVAESTRRLALLERGPQDKSGAAD
jgi:tetratricopeptide (TPR) repeat protein